MTLRESSLALISAIKFCMGEKNINSIEVAKPDLYTDYKYVHSIGETEGLQVDETETTFIFTKVRVPQ